MIALLACKLPFTPDPLSVSITSDAVEGRIPFAAQLTAESEAATFTWTLPDGSTSAGHTLEWTGLSTGDAVFSVVATDGDRTATADITLTVTKALCPAVGEPSSKGTVEDEELTEISGVAESATDPGTLYVIEDANNPAELVGLNAKGNTTGWWSLDWATARDWEDVTVGPDIATGDSMVWIADIGDNEPLDRESVFVAVVPEPVPGTANGAVDGFEIELTYADGPHDAEAMFVDPVTGDLIVVGKDYEGEARIWRKAAPHGPGEAELEEIAVLDFSEDPLSGGAVTAATISPLGDLIVIRTYSSLGYAFRRDQAEPLEAAFDSKPCEVELPNEAQSESIGFAADGTGWWTVSEAGTSGDAPDVWFTPRE